MIHHTLKSTVVAIIGLFTLLVTCSSFALPAVGDNKVAYYAFDATTVGQTMPSLISFTDHANIVVVFEGTLWELADTVHYNSNWMRNAVYSSKKQILNDIQKLRSKGVLVLMNVDDAASWSTATPFTTWNGKALTYVQFAAFVDSCVTAVGLDGISMDVEHKATDNSYYRNLIIEFGKYFGPLSTNASTRVYTGAFYSGRDGPPGPIFREVALSQYLNFVMDMGYKYDNATRFDYWAATLGNSKVMNGMSHQYNSQSSAVDWASWHPTPDKAGVMVFAANVSKSYTDAIFAALNPTLLKPPHPRVDQSKFSFRFKRSKQSIVCSFSLAAPSLVSATIVSVNGTVCRRLNENRYNSGGHSLHWSIAGGGNKALSSGMYIAVLTVNGSATFVPFTIK